MEIPDKNNINNDLLNVNSLNINSLNTDQSNIDLLNSFYLNVDPKNIHWVGDWSHKSIIPAFCFHVYDGDTIHVMINDNNSIVKQKCRLADIDCPEIRSHNEKEKSLALKAKEFVSSKILNKVIFIKGGKTDKYGRTLIEIYLEKPFNISDYTSIAVTSMDLLNMKQPESLNKQLINMGLAYTYTGNTKILFDDWCSVYTSENN
jgi:endonuclease YncB( thermonuclease family)